MSKAAAPKERQLCVLCALCASPLLSFSASPRLRVNPDNAKPRYGKGGPGIPRTALRMVSGRKRAHEASIACLSSDNAPLNGLPTPLLNHETSVTSFHAVKPFADPAGSTGPPRVDREWPLAICESNAGAQQVLHCFFLASESAASRWRRGVFHNPQRQSSITRLNSGQAGR